jgi:hypothetical protein
MNLIIWRTIAATCVMWALAPGCGGGGQDETTAATPGTTTETAPTEATDSAPTEGTTESDPSTDGTTADSGDPELAQLCRESFADGHAIIVAQCQCLFDQGGIDDVEECAADPDGVTDECTCDVYSQFPQTKTGLECARPAQTAALACLADVSCVDSTDAFSACISAYFMAIEACEGPAKDAVSQVAIQCAMEAPFMCGSSEVIPESWRCDFSADCGDASDELDCPGSFQCADGMGFLPGGLQCNGSPECADASDEAGCPTFMCMDGAEVAEAFKCDGKFDCEDMSDETMAGAGCDTFACTSGPEIPKDWQCDGFLDCCGGEPDCADMSDETDCPTFMCTSGETIPLPAQCNGLPDCRDGSDEVDCPTFVCGSGEEVPLDWKCDGEADCRDGSDEADCP